MMRRSWALLFLLAVPVLGQTPSADREGTPMLETDKFTRPTESGYSSQSFRTAIDETTPRRVWEMSYNTHVQNFSASPKANKVGWKPAVPQQGAESNFKNIESQDFMPNSQSTIFWGSNDTRDMGEEDGNRSRASFRRARTFPFESFRTINNGGAAENPRRKAIVIDLRRNLSSTPYQDIMTNLFINEVDKSPQQGAIPVRNLVVTPTRTDIKTNSAYQLKPHDVPVREPALYSLSYAPENAEIQRYETALSKLKTDQRLKPTIQEAKEIGSTYIPNLGEAFDDFNSNIMTMFPIDKKPYTSEDYTESSASHNYERRAGSGVDGLDPFVLEYSHVGIPKSATSSEESQKFLEMWHDTFGNSAADTNYTVVVSPSNPLYTQEPFIPPKDMKNGISFKEHRSKGLSQVKETAALGSRNFANELSHDPLFSENSTPLPSQQYNSPTIVYEYNSSHDSPKINEVSETTIRDLLGHMKNRIHNDATEEEHFISAHNSKIFSENKNAGDIRPQYLETVVGTNFRFQDSRDTSSARPSVVSDSMPSASQRDSTLAYLMNLRSGLKKNKKQRKYSQPYGNREALMERDSTEFQQVITNKPRKSNEFEYSRLPKLESIIKIPSKEDDDTINIERNSLAQEDDDKENLFTSHFQSPSTREGNEMNTIFKVVNETFDSHRHSTPEPRKQGIKSTESRRSNVGLKSVKDLNFSRPLQERPSRRYSAKRKSTKNIIGDQDSGPWKPASPVLPKQRRPTFPRFNRLKKTTSTSVPKAHILNGGMRNKYHVEEEIGNMHPIEKTSSISRKTIRPRNKNKPPSQNSQAVGNIYGLISQKKNVKPKVLAKKGTRQSWPRRLFNFVSNSLFGENKSQRSSISHDSPENDESAISRGPDDNKVSDIDKPRRQKWPRISQSEASASPVVGTREYLTVTAVAALGTLSSMVLFGLNNPFAGRGKYDQMEERSDPLVEKTIKFLTDAAAEYENHTADIPSKGGVAPILISEFQYPEDRENKEHVNEMLNTINTKHTTNIKNKLALFVLNAHSLLKKYPSDSGINRLLRKALDLYKKMRFAWAFGRKGKSSEESAENDEWKPLNSAQEQNLENILNNLDSTKKSEVVTSSNNIVMARTLPPEVITARTIQPEIEVITARSIQPNYKKITAPPLTPKYKVISDRTLSPNFREITVRPLQRRYNAIKENSIFKKSGTTLPPNFREITVRPLQRRYNAITENSIFEKSGTTLPILELPTSTLPPPTRPPAPILRMSTLPTISFAQLFNFTPSTGEQENFSPIPIITTKAAMRKRYRTDDHTRSRKKADIENLLVKPKPVPRSRIASKGLNVSPFSRSDLLKLSEENEARRRVIINNVLQDYGKTHPPGSLGTNKGVILPPAEKKPKTVVTESARRGVFINNELHATTDHLSYVVSSNS